MIYLIPFLQAKLRFSGNLLGAKQQTDPKTMYFTIGGIVAFFLIVILINKISSSNGALKQQKGIFKRKAKELELNNNQIKLLINLLKTSDIKKPLLILTHPTSLNNLLRKAIKDIRKDNISANVKENKIITLYRIKHHLDKYQKNSQVRSTHELSVGTNIVIERNDKKSYTSSVIGNYENYFAIKLPTDSVGNQIKWNKGSMVKLIAFDRNEKESYFLTKTLGIKNIGPSNAIIIAHTIKTNQSIARSFERVDVSLSTYVYLVEKVFDSVNKVHRFKTNKNSSRVGKLLDISSGGCSITMKVPFPEKSLIELNFDLDGKTSIKLQGVVLKLRIARGKKITHIKFTRASAKNLNAINNFIYSLG